MKICPYCHNELPHNFFRYEMLMVGLAGSVASGKTVYLCSLMMNDYQPQDNPVPAQESEVPVYNNYDLGANNGTVTPIPIGGYVAWSIFVILFCTIPGIAALFYVLRINRATTPEEQLKTLDTAKKILIVGTVLAVINLVSTIASNM